MSLAAILPAALAEAANASLAEQGHGLRCFSILAWGAASAAPAFAALHTWHHAPLVERIKALDGVIWEEDGEGTPRERVAALIAAQGAEWGSDAPELPDGMVQPGLYRYGDDGHRRIIQAYDRSIYGGDPADYPALARIARDPRRVLPWKQPIDGFDAYQIETGFGPERVVHNGVTWVNTVAGNVWAPSVYGWDISS